MDLCTPSFPKLLHLRPHLFLSMFSFDQFELGIASIFHSIDEPRALADHAAQFEHISSPPSPSSHTSPEGAADPLDCSNSSASASSSACSPAAAAGGSVRRLDLELLSAAAEGERSPPPTVRVRPAWPPAISAADVNSADTLRSLSPESIVRHPVDIESTACTHTFAQPPLVDVRAGLHSRVPSEVSNCSSVHFHSSDLPCTPSPFRPNCNRKLRSLHGSTNDLRSDVSIDPLQTQTQRRSRSSSAATGASATLPVHVPQLRDLSEDAVNDVDSHSHSHSHSHSDTECPYACAETSESSAEVCRGTANGYTEGKAVHFAFAAEESGGIRKDPSENDLETSGVPALTELPSTTYASAELNLSLVLTSDVTVEQELRHRLTLVSRELHRMTAALDKVRFRYNSLEAHSKEVDIQNQELHAKVLALYSSLVCALASNACLLNVDVSRLLYSFALSCLHCLALSGVGISLIASAVHRGAGKDSKQVAGLTEGEPSGSF